MCNIKHNLGYIQTSTKPEKHLATNHVCFHNIWHLRSQHIEWTYATSQKVGVNTNLYQTPRKPCNNSRLFAQHFACTFTTYCMNLCNIVKIGEETQTCTKHPEKPCNSSHLYSQHLVSPFAIYGVNLCNIENLRGNTNLYQTPKKHTTNHVYFRNIWSVCWQHMKWTSLVIVEAVDGGMRQSHGA